MKLNFTFLKAILCVSVWVLNASFAFGLEKTTSTKIKVFLLAGQSNMEGKGDGARLSERERKQLRKAQSHVRFAYNGKPVVPLGLTIPTDKDARKYHLERSFGPELFFGTALSEAWPNESILLIKYSSGGTSLYGCWNPDWSIERARVTGEERMPALYQPFIAYVRDVLSGYKPDAYEICGMLWVQGEKDSAVDRFGPLPAESYASNLRHLIHSVRTDMEVPRLPFIMLQVGDGKVVEGMRETAEILDHVYFIPQSKDPDSPHHYPKYPIGHYNHEGMKRIGSLFAKVYLDQDRVPCPARAPLRGEEDRPGSGVRRSRLPLEDALDFLPSPRPR